MKLATLRNGARDGQLVIVSRDLTRCVPVPEIAATMQAALDDWSRLAPALMALADGLEHAHLKDARQFDAADALAPLPRAYQWLDGSAYVNHVELVRRARGAVLPESFWIDPLMYQGGSDDLQGGRADIVHADPTWGIDCEAEIAVVTGDVAVGTPATAALQAVRLMMLVNDVSLRNLIPAELAKGFGFVQSKPATAFSPVAVTPDELGSAWRDGKLHRRLTTTINGTLFGQPDAGTDMTFDFGQLIAHAARTRRLGAGTIVGSGTVSNREFDAAGVATPGRPAASGGVGYSCIAEQRTVETLMAGAPATAFLKHGDRVRIDMLDAEGKTIFGAIDQVVRAP